MDDRVKHFILRLLERAGYVVQKATDYAQAQRDIAKVLAAERKLAQADQDFRLGRDRDSRELEQARSESWQLHERLATALDEICRLKSLPKPDEPEPKRATPPLGCAGKFG